jgi:hypothetical protein
MMAGMSEQPATSWYAVRCIFRDLDPQDAFGIGPGEASYEERITLWRAESFDHAIELAEAEAAEYGGMVDSEYLGIAQAYISAEPQHGAEVFSLLRYSTLGRSEYLDHFFDTGSERQQRS